MFLSELNKGDFFKFIPGQTVHYLSTHDLPVAFEPNNHTIYEVLKQNKMSVKVKVAIGVVEYIFKYSGRFHNYQGAAQDSLVEKTRDPLDVE